MNNKYISILIPLYNGIEFLEDSVNSVINQTYKNWELLIGINGKYEDNDFKPARILDRFCTSIIILYFKLFILFDNHRNDHP